MFAEQAIFTSLQSRRQEGYQLAAVSPGVTGDVAKELAVWGPAHDSLLVSECGSSSINFHRLESDPDRYCISRTVADGEEYSGRAGPRIYTQMLIVPSSLLARFSNNPFAIIDAASASGQMPVHAQPPATLETVRLLGRASPVNQLRIAELVAAPGADMLLALVDAALSCERLAVRSNVPLERLVAGLFSLLPVDRRAGFSFSTGLRYSPRRPVRLLALPADTAEQRSIERSSEAKALDLTRDALPEAASASNAWSTSLRDVFRQGHLSALGAIVARSSFDS